jgi:hypothetical protein
MYKYVAEEQQCPWTFVQILVTFFGWEGKGIRINKPISLFINVVVFVVLFFFFLQHSIWRGSATSSPLKIPDTQPRYLLVKIIPKFALTASMLSSCPAQLSLVINYYNYYEITCDNCQIIAKSPEGNESSDVVLSHPPGCCAPTVSTHRFLPFDCRFLGPSAQSQSGLI